METTKIRMCPFCGHHGQKLEQFDVNCWGNKVDKPLYRVACGCCGAKGPEEMQKDWAIESWNHIYSEPSHSDDTLEIDFNY